MKALFILGVILIVMGVASLFVPFPVREKHSMKAGPLSVGVETTDQKKVDPIISVVLIGGGVLLTLASRGRRAAR
ncbi:MAG TPA: hypothetical protein VER58_09200 [Thermoanaerobaculia bacterium]|nr:hypothetical protein [Thermoanaerobaculia bacterium]